MKKNIALVFVWFYRVEHRFRKRTVKVCYGLYKTARSQHIYLSCNERGKSRITSTERVQYIEETRKKSVSGTKPSVSVPSWSEYVSRNKRKICFRKVNWYFRRHSVWLPQQKQEKNVFPERLGLMTKTYRKVVRFRCDRSNGNTRKLHQTDSGNAC